MAARHRSRDGWPWFFAWAIPGVALGLQVSVIGIPVLPVGALSASLLLWLGRRWPEPLGLLEGMAGVALCVAFLNRDYRPCPAHGAVGEITVQPGEASSATFSCGGIDPVVSLVVGLALALIGFVLYALVRRSMEVTRG